MHRHRNLWARALGLVLITTALVALLVLPSGLRAAEPVGEVARMVGSAKATRADTSRGLNIGSTIYQSDQIITGPDSKLAIQFSDGSTLSIGADTSVEITDYTIGGDGEGVRGLVNVFLGIIRTSLSESWDGGFSVRSRSAVAAVRSTDWITESRNDRSSVFVVSGEVAVSGLVDGRSVRLRKGFGTDVDSGGSPTPAKQWGAARVEGVLARTNVP